MPTAFVAALASLRRILAAHGLDDPRRLAALEGVEEDVVADAVGRSDEHFHPLVHALHEWVGLAQQGARRLHLQRAREGLQDALWAVAESAATEQVS